MRLRGNAAVGPGQEGLGGVRGDGQQLPAVGVKEARDLLR